MSCTDSQLFNQATSQLNFLLLSQRTVVLLVGFNIAFATFISKRDYYLSRFLVMVIFIYSIAYGIVAAVDFNKYIKDTKEEIKINPENKEKELELLDSFGKWSNFSYVLVSIVIFIMLTYTKVEFFNRFQYLFGLRKNRQ